MMEEDELMLHRIVNVLLNRLSILFRKVYWGKKLSLDVSEGLRRDTRIIIEQGGHIDIGMLSTNSNVHLSAIGGNLSIGRDVFLNRNCIVICRKEITIGDNCIFGPNVVIYDHDHEFDIEGIRANSYKAKPIVIEKGCWIGAGAIVLKGANIGEGSIIGAGVVVKGDVPPHSLVTMDRELKITKLEKR